MPENVARTQRSFTGGEQSPNLDARADLDRWAASLQIEENFVSLPYGGAEKAPGTQFVHEAFAASVLRPFAFSDSDGFAIEFGVGLARLYRDYAVVLGDDGNPYTFVTPFTVDDLPSLYCTQANDVIYITCGRIPMQRLVRNGPTDWIVSEAVTKNGPFLDENGDDTLSIAADAPAGGEFSKGTFFTLTASAALFTPGMVGGQILIREKDGGEYGQWSAESDNFNSGDFCRWGDNSYKCVDIHGTQTGDQPPVHEFGARWDGNTNSGGAARKWLFLHSGYGVAKITQYNSETQVVCQAMSYIPHELTLGTTRFALGSWHADNGYPTAVELHGDRLIAGGTAAFPNRYDASVLDDFQNFDLGHGEDDMAFSRTLVGNNKVNAIRWLKSGQRLAIGTSGDEFAIQNSSVREPLTPDNAITLPATDEGSAANEAPIKVGSPIWLSPDRRRVHLMGYDFSSDDFQAADLTEAAEHITGDGITNLAFQREPYSLILALRASNGMPISCTYRKQQQVIAWARWPRQGKFRSIAVVPNPDGTNKDVWAIVERAIGGTTKRYVECFKRFFNRGAGKLEDAWFVDSGLEYRGDPVSVVTGLDHLEGKEVAILADGQLHARQTVKNGKVPLDRAASHVIAGLPYTARLVTLRLASAQDGALSPGRRALVKSITLDVLNSVNLRVAFGAADETDESEIVTPTAGIDMNRPAQLFSGVTDRIPVDADWSKEPQVTVLSSDPLPATILSITPNYQVSTHGR